MIRKVWRWTFYRLLERLGLPITDHQTGKLLAKVLPLPWCGSLRLIGLPDYKPIRFRPTLGPPAFFQSIALRAELLPPPDFPSLRPANERAGQGSGFPRFLVVVLAHQSPARVEAMLQRWREHLPASADLLLVHGGRQEDFDSMAHEPREFVADPALRTRRPRADNQSLAGVVRAIVPHLQGKTHVFFAEYDLLPLGNLGALFLPSVEYMEKECADVIFPLLSQVDGTCQEVYLQQASRPEFCQYWSGLTRRSDPSTAFWALFPGSVWTSEALKAAAAHPEPFPCYFEIYLPTLLHHLGFRLRQYENLPLRILGGGNLRKDIARLTKDGVLAIHPVK